MVKKLTTLRNENRNVYVVAISLQHAVLTAALHHTNTTLTCTYDQSGPEFLLMIFISTDHVTEWPDPRLSISLRKNENKVHLEIFPVAVLDSALYYCTMEPTMKQNSNRLYKPEIWCVFFPLSRMGAVYLFHLNTVFFHSSQTLILFAFEYEQSSTYLCW